MTMRLDIVTSDAGDLVRRERAREQGAVVLQELYRLVKLLGMHDRQNAAFVRQRDQTFAALQDYHLKAGAPFNVLFAFRTVFLGGQLLKGSKSVYDAAGELGVICEKLGGSELTIHRELGRDELDQVLEAIAEAQRSAGARFSSPTSSFILRPVDREARLRGLELEEMSPAERVTRTYASAVVAMRRFYEDLEGSRYRLPRRIKRIAQSLVDLSSDSARFFLGVTEAKNANYDDAGRAVNGAILAVSLAREILQDRKVLANIAMAALLYDVARPRALALAAGGGAEVFVLGEDQLDLLPAQTAAVLVALGRLNEPSIVRTVAAVEARWLERESSLGAPYRGVRSATMAARIVRIARRYNQLITPEPGLPAPSPGSVLRELYREVSDDHDRELVRALASALRAMPKGTRVRLHDGREGDVVDDVRAGEAVEVELSGGERIADARIEAVLDVAAWEVPSQLAESMHPAAHEADDSDELSWGGEPAAEQDVGTPTPPPAAPAEALVAPVEARQGSYDPEQTPPSMPSAADVRLATAPQPTPAPLESAEPHTVFQPSSAPLVSVLPAQPQELQPSAEGILADQPLPHVLLHALDRRLTGSLVFTEPDGVMHYVFVRDGVAAQAHIGLRASLIGEVLQRLGMLDRATLDSAAAEAEAAQQLFGQHLLQRGLVSADQLGRALEAQLVERLAAIGNQPPRTAYAFYDEENLLAQTPGGDELLVTSPLNAILATVRVWSEETRMEQTLKKIWRIPLAFHVDTDRKSYALTAEEELVMDRIVKGRPTLDELLAENLTDRAVVVTLVYFLAITRQLAWRGQKRSPLGLPGTYPRSAFAPPLPPHGRNLQRGDVLPPKPRIRPLSSQQIPAQSVPEADSVPPPPFSTQHLLDAERSGAHAAVQADAALHPAEDPQATLFVTSSADLEQLVAAAAGASVPAQVEPTPASVRPAPVPTAPITARSAPPPADLAASIHPAQNGPGSVRPDSLQNGPGSVRPGAMQSAPASVRPGAMQGAPRPISVHPSEHAARPMFPESGGPSRGQAGGSVATSSSRITNPANAVFEAVNAAGALANGELREALVHARRALALDPDEPEYDALVAYLDWRGGGAAATSLERLESLVVMFPERIKLQLMRAELLRADDRLDDALSAYRDILDRDPALGEAARAVAELASLLDA